VAGDIEYVEKNYQDLFSQTLLRGLNIKLEEEKQLEPLLSKKQNWSEFLKDKPTVKQISFLIAAAIKSRATDLHFEPEEKEIKIRERIDGVLYEMASFDLREAPRLINEIKNLSGLNTEETQKVQEGRFRVILKEKSYDIRLSILPAGYGESASLRILGEEIQALDLEKIGLLSSSQTILEKVLQDKVGLILASGPTSSGKTTTLFALLKKLNQPDVKIITIEDPIEYRLAGVNQTQINEEKGYTFSNALRTLLRQNPNIFLIGEIRDKETAEMVWQASLTGHLVLSTIHANSAASAISRFVGLGVERQALANSIEFAIGQRLARRICPHCKQEVQITPEELEKVKSILDSINNPLIVIPEKLTFYKGSGCEKCGQIGYKGRIGLYEALTMSPGIQKIIQGDRVTDFEVEQEAIKNRMVTMLQDGIIKALKGETSLEEVFRVI